MTIRERDDKPEMTEEERKWRRLLDSMWDRAECELEELSALWRRRGEPKRPDSEDQR